MNIERILILIVAFLIGWFLNNIISDSNLIEGEKTRGKRKRKRKRKREKRIEKRIQKRIKKIMDARDNNDGDCEPSLLTHVCPQQSKPFAWCDKDCLISFEGVSSRPEKNDEMNFKCCTDASLKTNGERDECFRTKLEDSFWDDE